MKTIIQKYAIIAFSGLLLAGCSAEYNYQRVTADSIGGNCDKVTFVIDKFKLETTTGDFIYSLVYDNNEKPAEESVTNFIWSFVGDGEPETVEMFSEVYQYDDSLQKTTRIGVVTPPSNWKSNAMGYSIKTRTNKDGDVFVGIRGCENAKDNICTKNLFYKIKDQNIEKIEDFPVKTKKEKRMQKQCASTIKYKNGYAIIGFFKKDGIIKEVAEVENTIR